MPHVIVKLYPGRTESQKLKCAEKITKALIETMNVDEKSVSVAFEEVPKEMWKDTVYQPDIVLKENTLVKKPGYKID